MLRNIITILLLMVYSIAHAIPVNIKTMHISRSGSPINLDGILDEPAWQGANKATDFHQKFPADTSGAITRKPFAN